MLGFLIFAAALVGICIAMLVPALFGRTAAGDANRAAQNVQIARWRLAEAQQTGDAESQTEIKAALLDDLAAESSPERAAKAPRMATKIALLTGLPAAAFALYFVLGTPAALQPQTAAPAVQDLLTRLEARLANEPDNADGWTLAGKTYLHLGRYGDAAAAFERLHALRGDDAEVLAAWASAELLANEGGVTPEIRRRVARAVELDPGNENARRLAAMMEAAEE